MRSEIVGEKVVLRKYEADFIPLLFEAAVESKGGKFSRWMPWCHETYTIEESREFIEKVEKSWSDTDDIWRSGVEFAYAIFDAETERFLGGIGLNQPNKQYKFFNLGYWIRVSQQQRGIASAATRLLSKTAFEDLPINRIEILTAIENIASQKTAEKSGATREGVLRKRLIIGGTIHDAVLFSFVREDFTIEK